MSRENEIQEFSKLVRAAAAAVAPDARSDAARFRALANELDAGSAAVKKWFYAQNAPRGAAAKAIAAELNRLIQKSK